MELELEPLRLPSDQERPIVIACLLYTSDAADD